MKRLLTLLVLALAVAMAYVLWQRRQALEEALSGREPQHWPGLDQPVYYATPEERRRYRD